MKSVGNIRELIKRLRIRPDADADRKVHEGISQALEEWEQTRQTPIKHNIGRIIMKSKITKVAAAAVIVVAALIHFFGDAQQTLYAQVLEAFENARKIHVTGRSLQNGQFQKSLEVWCDDERGLVETEWLNGQRLYTRIDNGKYEWRHEAGSRVAKRSDSVDPRGIIRRLLNIAAFKEQAERDAGHDKTVNGIQCAAYVSSKGQIRIITWLDAENHVRAWEKSRLLDDGQWETYRIGEVEYDIEAEPNTFVPDFGPDVKVVEVDTILDDYFGLDKAIVTKEALGFIFAVHQVRKCKGNVVYVVCSLRPTEQTRKEVPAYLQGPAVWSFGSFHLGSSYRQRDRSSKQGSSYQPVDLSVIYHAGLQVKSTLLVPEDSWPEAIDQCELEAYVSVVGCQLKAKRTAKGVPCEERSKPLALVPLPPEELGLDTILEEVYSTAKTLEAFVGYDKLILKSVPFTDKEMEDWIREHPSDLRVQEYRSDKSSRLHHGGPRKPSEISKEDWTKDRVGYLQELKNR